MKINKIGFDPIEGIGRAEQLKYQEMFVNKKFNALSCSTTFETEVDVGDLETAY